MKKAQRVNELIRLPEFDKPRLQSSVALPALLYEKSQSLNLPYPILVTIGLSKTKSKMSTIVVC